MGPLWKYRRHPCSKLACTQCEDIVKFELCKTCDVKACLDCTTGYSLDRDEEQGSLKGVCSVQVRVVVVVCVCVRV